MLPGLAVAAAGLSLAVQHVVYPALSWNRDEPVYLWQVEVLRSGQLSSPDGGHPDLFLPWLSAARDGEIFSQYTLGWPLVLLLGSVLGSSALAVAAGTSLAVAGTWILVEELTGDRRVASLAGLLMLASPIVAVQGGVYLNYLFTLGLGLLFVAWLRRGVRERSRWRLFVAGLLLGWIFFTRPFDAAVWGLLGTVPVVVRERHHLRSLVRPTAWCAAGLLPLVAVTLLVNLRLTGSPTEFPITTADPLDSYGFGMRRLMPLFQRIKYGPRLAATSAGRNAFWLPFFLVGAHLGIGLAAIGAWQRRRDGSVHLLVALGLAFPLTYLMFFGTHISSLTSRLSGPIYYLPAYAALCGLIALALATIGRRRPRAAAVLAAALVIVTLPIAGNRLLLNHRLSEANEPWRASTTGLDRPALVITPPQGSYLLFANPFGENGADLDGEVLFASDNGPSVLELVEEHRDRDVYLQRADRPVVELGPSEHPRPPVVQLTPMVLLGGDLRVSGTVAPLPDVDATVWWVAVDEVPRTAATEVTARAEVEVDVRDLGMAEGLHTVDVLVGRGDTPGEAATQPLLRRRFYVRVTGDEVVGLAPGTAARFIRRNDGAEPEWLEAITLAHLRVDLVGTPIR